MSAKLDTTKSNLDNMIAQAKKSKSKKQFRLARINAIADQATFDAANERYDDMDERTIVSSMAISSLQSATITEEIRYMNSNETSWAGFRTTEFIVYDVLNQEVSFVGVDARTFA